MANNEDTWKRCDEDSWQYNGGFHGPQYDVWVEVDGVVVTEAVEPYDDGIACRIPPDIIQEVAQRSKERAEAYPRRGGEQLTEQEVREAIAWLQSEPASDDRGPLGRTPAEWALTFGVAVGVLCYSGKDEKELLAPIYCVLRALHDEHGCLDPPTRFEQFLKLRHTCGRPSEVPTEDGYPDDWPRCPGCGRPALDGHITCGDVRCNEGAHRRGEA